MVPAGVTIRATVADDAEPIARLQVDVWEDAYADPMPATVFVERRATIAERIDRWHRILAEAPSRTTVAEFSTGLIGFASVGPPRADDVNRRGTVGVVCAGLVVGQAVGARTADGGPG